VIVVVYKKRSDLAFIVAELIRRMDPEERAELVSYLSWEELKGESKEKEPELYIAINQNSISFETPLSHLTAVLSRLAEDLEAEKITIRFDDDDESISLRTTADNLKDMLEEYWQVLEEGIMIIEYDRDTLYSNGGGCLLLKTEAPDEIKQKIAQHFLEICGFPSEIRGSRFKALVFDGQLRVVEE
jgi:hypothetical protein